MMERRWSKEGEFADALSKGTTLEQQLTTAQAEAAALRAEVEALREVAGLYERAFDAAEAFIESHVADPDITDEMTVNYWRYRQHSEAVEVSRAAALERPQA